MSLTPKEKEISAKWRALPQDDIEAHYRFLIEHNDELGRLGKLWETVIMMCSREERMRIEEKLREEGLL